MIKMKITKRQINILKLLSEGNNPNVITSILRANYSSIYKSVKSLESKGLIKIDHITTNMNEYNITQKGVQLIQQKVILKTPKIRTHRLEIKCNVPFNKQPRWEQHLNKVLTVTDYKEFEMNNWTGKKLFVDNIRVKTTTKSILFYPDDIYADSVGEAHTKITKTIERIIPKIEKKLKINMDNWDIEISTQEWAFQNDPVAQKYIDEGKRAIINVNGQRRIVIDYSKRIPELETVHRRHSPTDAKAIENLYRDVITGNFNHREMLKQNEMFWNNLVAQNKMVTRYAEEIQTHTKLLETATNTIRILQDETTKLRKENKTLKAKESQKTLFKFIR